MATYYKKATCRNFQYGWISASDSTVFSVLNKLLNVSGVKNPVSLIAIE